MSKLPVSETDSGLVSDTKTDQVVGHARRGVTPAICQFEGIVIRMYFIEHSEPRTHPLTAERNIKYFWNRDVWIKVILGNLSLQCIQESLLPGHLELTTTLLCATIGAVAYKHPLLWVETWTKSK